MAGAPERWLLGGGGGTRGRRKARDRLDSEPVLPFKCTYPVYLTDMMDTSPSSPADLLRSSPGSPVRGTRTRAVRVYEQTIQELKKENFDLKLRLFIMEETLNKHFVKKGGNSEDSNGIGNVIVNLQVEVENLKTEVENKSQLLHQTSELADNYESELRQVQLKFEKLQKESADYAKELLERNEELLNRLQEVPSRNEIQMLLDEKAYLADENANLSSLLSEQEASILELKSQLESVTNAKNAFEKKAKKGSLAIQGLVYKYHKDTENIPKDIRPIVQSAVQAAKDSNEADMLSAVENLRVSLFQIMSASSDGAANTSNSASRKEATMQAEIEDLHKSFSVLKSSENIDPASEASKSKSKSFNELSHKSSIERLAAISSESLEESGLPDLEPEDLKAEIKKKSNVIHALEQKVIHLESELLKNLSKLRTSELKQVEEKRKSTNFEPISDQLLETSALMPSGDIDDLREENLRLLLDIDKKEKDIADLQETIQKMEEKPNEVSNIADMDFINERNELHQKLADCTAVNRDLYNHLKSLEKFMEDLLLNRTMDSSMESLNEASNYLSRLTSCLNQTMRLSNILTDHLSVCEGSKVFDPSELSMSRDYNPERTSLPFSDHSQMDVSTATDLSAPDSSKSSFICKKCLSHQSADAPETDRLNEYQDMLNAKITLINELTEEKENLLKTAASLKTELSNLKKRSSHFEAQSHDLNSKLSIAEKNNAELNNSVKTLQEKLLHSEKGLSQLTSELAEGKSKASELDSKYLSLREAVSENNKLKQTVSDMETKLSRYDSQLEKLQSELSQTKSKLSVMDAKCSEYESKLSASTEEKASLEQHLKGLEKDRQRLVSEVENLQAERKELVQSIQVEKYARESLEKDVYELNADQEDKVNSIKSMQAAIQNLEEKVEIISKEKEAAENKLLSSSSTCTGLEEELTKTKGYLEDLMTKTSTYKKELGKASTFKQDVDNKLTTLISELVPNLNKFKNVCDLYVDHKVESESDIVVPDFETVSDRDEKIKNQLDMIGSANVILDRRINLVSEALMKSKTVKDHLNQALSSAQKELKLKESKLEHVESQNRVFKAKVNDSDEKIETYKLSNDQIKSKMEAYQQEVQSLENRSRAFQNEVRELEETIAEKEKQLRSHKERETSLLKQVNLLENKIENYQNLINQNEDEITRLQERIFNLQTEMSVILSEKSTHPSQTDTRLFKDAGFGSREVLMPSRDVGVGAEALVHHREVATDTGNLVHHREVGVDPESMFQFRNIGSGSQTVLVPSREVAVDSKSLIQLREIGVGSRSFIEYKDTGIGSKEAIISSRHASIGSESGLIPSDGFESKSLIRHREDSVDSRSSIELKDAYSGSKDAISSSSRHASIGSESGLIPSDGFDSKSLIRHRADGVYSMSSIELKDTGRDSKDAMISSRHASIGSRSGLIPSDGFDPADFDDSVSSSTSERYVDIEKKQAKRIKALQAKVEFYEKRIQTLIKEKNDLREELVAQMEGCKRASKTSVDSEKELTEVKDKLEAKTSFIRDLKKELQNSYNLLIEKQKEVDELYKYKQVSEANAAAGDSLNESFSDPLHSKTESVIDMLKKRKWELIHGIFKQEKQFYEKKNIHLGHFEKFKNHIEKLRSLQVTPMQKSGSDPGLNRSLSSMNYVEKCDATLQNLQLELTLDVEYLQNLQIFLKRFFIPFILNDCDSGNTKTEGSRSNHSVQESAGDMLPCPCESSSSNKFESLKLNLEPLLCTSNSADRLVAAASVISCKVDSLECTLKSLKSEFGNLKELESPTGESPRKSAAKSLLAKLENELSVVDEKLDQVSQLNSLLKSLDLSVSHVPRSPTKDMSDRESVLSEETITLSRSGSLSPMSFEEHFPTKLVSPTKTQKNNEPQKDTRGTTSSDLSRKPVGGSQESLFQRSHFSSPDLGIESDPNHESSAPEQAEFRDNKKGLDVSMKLKQVPSVMNTSKLIDDSYRKGESLHAIGLLQHYKLLKKEVQESLVGIKIVLSRTDDGLQHVTRFSSPRKNIESSTFKAIRDESMNIAICLKEASKLVDNFWIAPCPSVEELKALNLQNRDLQSQLGCLQEAKQRQQLCFEQAMEKLKNAEDRREKLEKNISRKLVKTKKVMREVENKMLHRKSQAQSPIPKYPCELPTCQSEQ